ncbi:MAG: PilZ domain-containing protein [Candidatus Omnitrophica bacterium]|nr:PilZ domain-containing protein [Candidatus Omnitrophota bacterium]
MADSEQRRSPRIARSFMVRYRVTVPQDTVWLVSPLRDLSSGGARLLSERPLAIGDQLELQLILPMAQQPVPLKARVAWVRPAPLGMVEIGVTFDPGDAGIQQTIDSAVAHFLRKQR